MNTVKIINEMKFRYDNMDETPDLLMAIQEIQESDLDVIHKINLVESLKNSCDNRLSITRVLNSYLIELAKNQIASSAVFEKVSFEVYRNSCKKSGSYYDESVCSSDYFQINLPRKKVQEVLCTCLIFNKNSRLNLENQ